MSSRHFWGWLGGVNGGVGQLLGVVYMLSSERWRVKSFSLMDEWEEKGNKSAAESWPEVGGEERTWAWIAEMEDVLKRGGSSVVQKLSDILCKKERERNS